jgi:hypothetical protein
LAPDQLAQYQSWGADERAAYDAWPDAVQAFYWTLAPERQAMFWRLGDNDKQVLSAMSDEEREAAWTIIETRMAEQGTAANENAEPPSPPEAAMPEQEIPPPMR